MTLRSVLLLTCATLLSCGRDERASQVAWDVAFGCAQDAENAALVSLRILRGGCGSSSVLYEARVMRDGSADEPPALATGEYGFDAQAFDSGDVLIASACETRTLPAKGPVRLVLASATNACASDDAGDAGVSEGDAGALSDAGIATDCGDRDEDGCDDCSYSASPDPMADGPEVNGDGVCDCVIFADASIVGAGDGKRWWTAFSNLQDAVDRAAELGDTCEVWVRQGTYYSYRSDVSDGLVMRRSIDLFGGFTGGELLRAQRSTDAALTVIDGRSAHSAAQRVTHVLTGASDITIEGVTIVGGDAAGVGEAGKGGGMINIDATLTLRNVRFLVNRAALGGGAMYNLRSDVLVARATFEGNSTAASGGAILDETGALTLRRCVFRDNQADDTQFGGGALYGRAGVLTIENGLFANNTAARWGGAILTESTTTNLTNCTIADNTAKDGGGFMGINGAMSTLKNNIVYDNVPIGLRAVSGATFDVSYSDIQGGFTGAGNIAVAPDFVAATTGDYHLAAGSLCVDAANGNVAPAADLDGRARVDAATVDTGIGTPSYVDIGAYELSP